MTALQLLSYLRYRDIQLWVEEGYIEYEAPEGALTSELLKQIQENKHELINLLTESERPVRIPPLEPVPRTGAHPLSFSQLRLWFLHQWDPGSSAYHLPYAWRLRGPLHRSAFEASLQGIVTRHEILRTIFSTAEGQPVQVIASPTSFTLPLNDLTAVGEQTREAEVARLIQEMASQPFDLNTGPLWRTTLLRLGEDDHIFLVTLHHIITDGWSMGIFWRELTALYTAHVSGKPSELPSLPIQYADFTVWQRQWLQGDILEQQLSYWQTQLADAPPSLDLPTDAPRPPQQTHQEAIQSFTIPPTSYQALRTLSREEGTTMFMVLLAAFQILLWRYTGQRDILVGSPIAGRTNPELEGLIGFFVNTLVLRTCFRGQPTFREVLRQVRETCLHAYAHQDLPFEKLVETLQPVRDPSRHPIFQVMFQLFQLDHTFGLTLPNLQVEPIRRTFQTDHFDLSLSCVATPETIKGNLTFNTSLFSDVTMARLITHYQMLLEGLVEDPEQAVTQVIFLTEAERHQLLGEWNLPISQTESGLCVHDLFEAQVARTPEAVAVLAGDQQLTYADLNRCANQLANYLRRQGVGPEIQVGLCVERGWEMMVGILGILKAGGAYVPLDPGYPQERLAFILNDALVPILVTKHVLRVQLPISVSGIVEIDTDWDLISQESEENLEQQVNEENLVYVIYTSGSTGSPKGVMIQHRSLVNYVQQAKDDFKLHSEDRVLQFASLSFDTSTEEIFPSLICGATLVLRSDSMVGSIAEFLNVCQEKGLTVLDLPTAFWHTLVAEMDTRVLTFPLSVRLLIIGGEQALPKRLKQWHQIVGQTVQLVNTYGPTETTVVATKSEISIREFCDAAVRPIPIGRTLPHVQSYVLDESGRPVPVGVIGELSISGVGVARGYLNQSVLTATQFLPNPYSSVPGSRMYRTGDRARFLSDGNLEFKGRVDNQIKLRGYRIELEEIETVLRQHPGIKDALVLAQEDNSGDKRLVAYVIEQSVDVNYLESLRRNALGTQVTQWEAVFNDLYQTYDASQKEGFYVKGWESSYTGQPISDEEVGEWMDSTVDRILSLCPRSVLELGCGGSGLMLSRIAPHCDQYWATDLSQNALNILKGQLEMMDVKLSGVKFLHRQANDFEGIEPESFDTVLIVSVVQYFPTIDYLVHVLEGATRVLKPGGHIFLGDVRSLPLLEAFHTSVELYRASSDLPIEQFKDRIRKNVSNEKQLVIAPDFFNALRCHLPKINNIDFQLQHGRSHNELNKFRYDVILSVSGKVNPIPAFEWLDWEHDGCTLKKVLQVLAEKRPAKFGIARVPNSRILAELKALELMGSHKELETVADLRNALKTVEGVGVDPEVFWSLQGDISYFVDIRLSGEGTNGSYDVIFSQKNTLEEPRCWDRGVQREKQSQLASWSHYANDPLTLHSANPLAQQLRGFLQEKLPHYMVPHTFMVLESFPLTAHGKLDRPRLSTFYLTYQEGEKSFVPPNTKEEKVIAEIWVAVLGVERVGIHDNFFELGGHSLSATQVASRVRDQLQVELPLRDFFKAATVAGLAALVEALQGTETSAVSLPISRCPRTDSLPLSFAQQRLWFLDQWEPGSSVYHLRYAWRLRGPLNLSALEASLHDMVARHESLRTSFTNVEGQPVQVIASTNHISLPMVDLSAFAEQAREAEVTRLIQEMGSQPFNLTTGPLWRATVLRLGEDDHIFLVTLHHIIIDGWSMGIFWRELTALYTAHVSRRPPELPSLPIQYADFTVWQRQWLQGDILEQQLSYWRTQLADTPPSLALPTDAPRPPQQSYRGASKFLSLPKTLTQKIMRLSQEEGVTLFMTCLAAFQILLSRYTGQRDILVGSPIAGRTSPGLEDLIGFFVNTLVLRTCFRGQPTFREVLRQVRETCLHAYAHQDLPFEKLVEALQPVRDPSRHPIFQVMFQLFQGEPTGGLSLANLQVKPIGGTSQTAKFDLALSLMATQETIQGNLIFNTDLFSDVTMARFVSHYQTLLEELLAAPEQPVTLVPFMTEAERHQLLVEWNPPVSQRTPKENITSLFENQVAKSPDSIAIVCGTDQMTYQTLNQRATQLAAYLQQQGVKPETPVGVCLERSLEMLIGLLGILKAGGVYVPIDPFSPLDRMTLILSEAKVPFVLTQSSTLHRLQSDFDQKNIELQLQFQWIAIDAMDLLTKPCAGLSVKQSVSPDNLAYIIFTSGSTGQPKGVTISYGNLTQFSLTAASYIDVQESDQILQFASLAFDAAVEEIFPCLIRGGTLVLRTENMIDTVSTFLDHVRDYQLTVLDLPTIYWHELTAVLSVDAFTLPNSVRLIIIGGEQAQADQLAIWHRHTPSNIQLVNTYGPTEATVVTTLCHCSKPCADEDHGGFLPVSIGCPLKNRTAYILDGHLQPSPIGIAGELYLGGQGLARGYLDQGALTAKAFLPNPFLKHPGARMYRSGDRGRYREDGTIELLGRVDHQVKIRGFRIELGEIEIVVRQHPAVQNAVVLCREDTPNEKQLAVYVLAETGTDLDSETLRTFLKTRLPDYMLPGAVMMLDAFPLTPSGKVDRHALPTPESSKHYRTRDFVAPRTPLEELLTDLWKELLKVEQISVHDNFFDLGGHSLLATRLLAKLKVACQSDLPLRMFFEQPTVEEQALSIEEHLLKEIEHLSDSEVQDLIEEDS